MIDKQLDGLLVVDALLYWIGPYIIVLKIRFRKKVLIILHFIKKVVTLQPQIRKKCRHIGIWCNGNTTDSGPVILGSSPSIPTINLDYYSANILFANILAFYMK